MSVVRISNENKMDIKTAGDIESHPTSDTIHHNFINIVKDCCRIGKKKAQPVSSDLDIDSPNYNMNHKKRGPAIIFSHKDYLGRLKCREGAEKDVSNLSHVLKTLGFDVTVHHDFTVWEIESEISRLMRIDYSECDCLFITILTHGHKENVLEAKDGSYCFDKLWKLFSAEKCPTLANKPKIFLIQACKGTKVDDGVVVHRKFESNMETDSAAVSYTIAEMSDFLLVYSAVEGYLSWRTKEEGTWFVKAFCQLLLENYKIDDLLKIMVKVSRRVSIGCKSSHSNPALNEKKQVPSMTSTLLRDIYFK